MSKKAPNWNSMLKKASLIGDVKMAREAISGGADIDICGGYVLLNSSFRGHLDVIKLIVSKKRKLLQDGDLAMANAASKGHLDIVKYLHERGVIIKGKMNKALCAAAKNGELAVVKYFVANKADTTNAMGLLLEGGALLGSLKMVKYALRRDPSNFMAKEKALKIAIRDGYPMIVMFLIESGVPWYIRRKKIMNMLLQTEEWRHIIELANRILNYKQKGEHR